MVIEERQDKPGIRGRLPCDHRHAAGRHTSDGSLKHSLNALTLKLQIVHELALAGFGAAVLFQIRSTASGRMPNVPLA